MSRRFEELAWAATPIGEVSLRRRHDPTAGVEVYEVKLDDEFLMSSLFTVAEVELARLGLAALPGAGGFDVVVGGLGLGFTAQAALDDERVRSVAVVEALDAVADWHEQGLVPFAPGVAGDPRCTVVRADFFAAALGDGFGPAVPERVHAVLLDVDHSPRHLLAPGHAPFYAATGLSRLGERLHPGGVFALWADGLPDPGFEAVLRDVFADVVAHAVSFPNPLTGGRSTSSVYVARR